MKIGNFDLVSRAMHARRQLIAKRDGAKIGVTLDGAYQDDEVVAAAKPAIVAVLDARIGEIDADLKSLGVTVD